MTHGLSNVFSSARTCSMHLGFRLLECQVHLGLLLQIAFWILFIVKFYSGTLGHTGRLASLDLLDLLDHLGTYF